MNEIEVEKECGRDDKYVEQKENKKTKQKKKPWLSYHLKTCKNQKTITQQKWLLSFILSLKALTAFR